MDKTRKRFKQLPFKTIILIITIPAIAIGLLLSNIITYYFVEDSSKKIITMNALSTVSQAARYIEVQLFDVFEEFYKLEKKDLRLDNIINIDTNEINNEYYIGIHNNLAEIFSRNENMLDIVFVGFQFPGNNNRYIYYSKDKVRVNSLSFNEQIGNYKLESAEVNDYIWSINGVNEVFQRESPSQSSVSLHKVIEDPKTKVKALIYFGFKNSFYREILFDNINSNDYYTALADKDSVILFPKSKNEKVITITDKELNNLNNETDIKNIKLNNESFIFIYDSIKLSEWKFASVMKESALFSSTKQVLRIYFVVFVCIFIPLIVLLYLSANMVTKPISNWVAKIRKIKADKFDIIFDDNICYEITQMNEGLEHLVDKIKSLLINVIEENEQKRNLELKLLQEQINPHFLYNTLFSIQELYNLGEYNSAVDMMKNLANFYRLCLSKGNEIVLIEDEIKLIVEYLQIQKVRHDNLSYQIYIDKEVMGHRILKLTLQPLIENAINHGLYGKDNGIVVVRGYMNEDHIIVKIIDNGLGIAENKLNDINYCLSTGDWVKMPDSYGIRNVQERLLIHYGKPFGLEYQSNLKVGTTVTIKIKK